MCNSKTALQMKYGRRVADPEILKGDFLDLEYWGKN
jgi:hypothetical protein